MMRALVIGTVLAACGGKPLASSGAVAGPRSGTGSEAVVVVEPAAAPGTCTADEDCVLVPWSHVACPTECGFCGDLPAVVKGTPAITCPPPPPRSEDMDPPRPAPNCSPCRPIVRERAACRHNACVNLGD